MPGFTFYFFKKCFACLYTYKPYEYMVLTEIRRGHWMPWNYTYGWLWATIWMLGIEPRSFARTRSALNYWDTFPDPRSHTFSNCDSRYHTQILMLVWLAFHWLNHRPGSSFLFCVWNRVLLFSLYCLVSFDSASWGLWLQTCTFHFICNCIFMLYEFSFLS